MSLVALVTLKKTEMQPLAMQPAGPYKVTIVNREYHAGRHIVNTEDIAREVNAMEQVSNCSWGLSPFHLLNCLNYSLSCLLSNLFHYLLIYLVLLFHLFTYLLSYLVVMYWLLNHSLSHLLSDLLSYVVLPFQLLSYSLSYLLSDLLSYLVLLFKLLSYLLWYVLSHALLLFYLLN